MRHLVALSGGKDSTAMALHLREAEADREYEFLITPTKRELPEMNAHWEKLECLLGQKLVRIPAPTLVDLIIKQKALPNWRMRWCTRLIKIEPFMLYAQEASPSVCYVGIRADEAGDREATDWHGIEGVKQDFPLVRWGWGLSRVKQYLGDRGIVIPNRTDCDICFWQQIGEWWRLWRDHKDRWMEGEALEHFTGHTFRSEQRDTWPASMKGMRELFEKGFVPRGAAQIPLGTDVSSRPAMCPWCAR